MAKKRKQPTETTETTTDQPPSNSISTNESTITSTNNNNHNISDGRYRNKSRLLLLSSRSTTARYRHLLEDLHTLLPHAKKESKLDVTKNDKGGFGAAINEIAEMNRCSSVAFLEVRKRGMDGYLWLGHTGHVEGTGSAGAVNTDTLTAPTFTPGPSAKFHITNIHTMDELKLTGNCMKGSRPILSFDQAFDSQEPELAHLKLVRHLMMQVFGTPRGHPRSKPFVDRVMAFYYGDGKIWVRNYQIQEQSATTAKEAQTHKKLTGHATTTSLIEIGPRFVLNPIRIFRGSFGGQTLYVNEEFVNPNVMRSEEKRVQGEKYVRRKGAEKKRKVRGEELRRGVPVDPLGDVFK